MGLFVLIVFGAQMFDRLLGGDRQVRDGAIGFVLATTVIAAVVAGLSFTDFYQSMFTKIWGYQTGALIGQTVTIMRADWIVGAARGGLLTALLAFAFTGKRCLWMILATLFLVADLGQVVNEINPRVPRRFFDPPPVARQFPPNRGDYRIFHEADWHGDAEIIGNSSIGGSKLLGCAERPIP